MKIRVGNTEVEAEACRGFFGRLRGLMFSRRRNIILCLPREGRNRAAIHSFFRLFPVLRRLSQLAPGSGRRQDNEAFPDLPSPPTRPICPGDKQRGRKTDRGRYPRKLTLRIPGPGRPRSASRRYTS